MTRLVRRLIALVVICTAAGYASTQDEIRKRQAELENLREQIRQFEETIRKQQQNERATLDLLDSYDRKAALVRRLITRLKVDERKIQMNVDSLRKGMTKLENDLVFLKQHYARYVSSVYKSGRVHDMELLLTAQSFNQFYVRTEYLKRFTEQRRNDARKIAIKKNAIEEVQARLQQQLSEERRLIAEKGAEEYRLGTLMADQKDALNQIRKDKKTVQREIDRKLKAAKQLEDLIASLIEADRLKKARELGRLPQPPPGAGEFESKKGKLRWPVSQGSIVASFGNQVHPTLKTVTQNTGIDIAVKAGTPVSSVAEAEVARIWWLPGYGNLVILDHYNGYRTVYSHLGEILVSEGQRIKEGEVIGTSGEALAGPRLHFELWKEREKQDPELWLGKP